MLTRLEGPATMPAVRVSAPQCGQSMLTGTRYHSFVSKDRWLVSGKPVLLFFWMDLQISAQNRHPAPCDKREMSSATLGVLQQTCTSMQFCSTHRRSAQDGEVGFGAGPTQSNPVVACSLPVADLFSQQRICRNNRFVPRHFRLGWFADGLVMGSGHHETTFGVLRRYPRSRCEARVHRANFPARQSCRRDRCSW